jgi:hypothetical protein
MGRAWRIEYEGALYHLMSLSAISYCVKIFKEKMDKDKKVKCHHRSKNQPKSSFTTQPERSKGAPMRLVLF